MHGVQSSATLFFLLFHFGCCCSTYWVQPVQYLFGVLNIFFFRGNFQKPSYLYIGEKLSCSRDNIVFLFLTNNIILYKNIITDIKTLLTDDSNSVILVL